MTRFAPVPPPPAAAGSPNVGKPVVARMPPPQGAPIIDPARPFPTPPQPEGAPAMGKPGGQSIDPAMADTFSPRPGAQNSADPRFFDTIRAKLANALMEQRSGAGAAGGAQQAPSQPPWAMMRDDQGMFERQAPANDPRLQALEALRARRVEPNMAPATQVPPGGADPRTFAAMYASRVDPHAGAAVQAPTRYGGPAAMAQPIGARLIDPRSIQNVMAQRAALLQGGADPKRQPLELPRPVASGGAPPSKQPPGKPAPPWVR